MFSLSGNKQLEKELSVAHSLGPLEQLQSSSVGFSSFVHINFNGFNLWA